MNALRSQLNDFEFEIRAVSSIEVRYTLAPYASNSLPFLCAALGNTHSGPKRCIAGIWQVAALYDGEVTATTAQLADALAQAERLQVSAVTGPYLLACRFEALL